MYFYCVCGCVLEFKFYLEIIVLDLTKIYVSKRVLLSALGPKQVGWRGQIPGLLQRG